MSFTPVGTTDTLETFRTRYNATSITLVDDSSTSVDITLATDSLKISGGTGIASAISGDVITLSASDASTSAKGIASFHSDNFAVSSGAVTIKDGGIIRAEIAADAIDGTKLADNAVNSEHYTDGSIDTDHIGDDQVTAAKLANTSVTAASYGSGSAIPVITVDAQGRITGVTTAAASSDLTISDTSSTTETFTLGSETLKFAGGTGVTSAISSGTVTYSFDGTSYTTFVYTATSGQTSFSGADGNGNTLAYSNGKRLVFLNGVLLDESDITASNGTSVVLSSGALVSDILTIQAFAVNVISTLDANGSEFVLDADGDTSITADTDDQIDIKIAGADDFVFTADKFMAAASSGILLTKTAAASDEATSAGALTSNNYNISHTLTLDGTLVDDAVLADFVVTSDKCLATSAVYGVSSLKCHVEIHTVAAGSFKVSITNKSGGTLANDSTMVLNYTIL